jgi:hypothetical protein
VTSEHIATVGRLRSRWPDAPPKPVELEQSDTFVYGEDERQEYFEVDAVLQHRARSVVALVPRSSLRLSDQHIVLEPSTLTPELCEDEPFSEQPRVAFALAPSERVNALEPRASRYQ